MTRGGNLAGGGESQVVSGRAVKADGGVFGLTEAGERRGVSTNRVVEAGGERKGKKMSTKVLNEGAQGV